MIAAALQLSAWSAAFWLALWLHARTHEPRASARFAVSLLAGALLARAGHALLWDDAAHALDTRQSVSVLFVPLGPLLLVPGPGAFACLPLPLALARLGCLFAGCCRGVSGEPLPLLEATALGALHVALARGPVAAAPDRFALAFGAIRLAEAPWRSPVHPTPTLLTPELVALAWLGLGGLGWLARRARPVTEPGRNAHASATRADAR